MLLFTLFWSLIFSQPLFCADLGRLWQGNRLKVFEQLAEGKSVAIIAESSKRAVPMVAVRPAAVVVFEQRCKDARPNEVICRNWRVCVTCKEVFEKWFA